MMDELTKQEIFSREVNHLINYYCDEFGLSYSSVIGGLELAKADVIRSYNYEVEEDEDAFGE